MRTLQSVYDISPVAIQNVMVSMSGAIKNKQRYGGEYYKHRAWLAEFDKWSLDRRLSYQAECLSNFVQMAARTSPFYKEFYQGIDLGSIREPSDLHKLPVLEKETLRQRMDDIYTIHGSGFVEGHTGGTTGKSLVVRYTHADDMRRMAVLDHFKKRHGFENRKMRKATFSGKHIVPARASDNTFWRYNAASRQMLYSTFDMTGDNLSKYVENINKFKPKALDGFFSSMSELATFIDRNGIQLEFNPVAIFPTSETITPRGRALLERVFGARVYDQYASSEGAPFVTECVAGALHIELSTGVFEQLPGSTEILVTSFHTSGTPLIRYRIGDSMQLGAGASCSCGTPTPLVASIQGRSDDYVVRADGAKVNLAQVANLFKNMPNSVIQSQVVQDRVGHIRVLLVTDPDTYRNDDDHALRKDVQHAMGITTQVEIEHVKAIPREASGKQRLIKNSLPGAEKR